MKTIVCIVEGDGDVEALPVLVRRIAAEGYSRRLVIPHPIRVRQANFLSDVAYRLRYLALARAKAGADGRVLVVLDADDACPAELTNQLLAAMAKDAEPCPLGFVLANKEFESWFLAGAESLAGHRHLEETLAAPVSPEGIRNAKGWLRERMIGARGYSPTIDQPALATVVDWRAARGRSPSLDKLCREIDRLTQP